MFEGPIAMSATEDRAERSSSCAVCGYLSSSRQRLVLSTESVSNVWKQDNVLCGPILSVLRMGKRERERMRANLISAFYWRIPTSQTTPQPLTMRELT